MPILQSQTEVSIDRPLPNARPLPRYGLSVRNCLSRFIVTVLGRRQVQSSA